MSRAGPASSHRTVPMVIGEEIASGMEDDWDGGWGCLTETGTDSSALGDSSSVTWKEGVTGAGSQRYQGVSRAGVGGGDGGLRWGGATGSGGTVRGTDSVPTLIMTVSQETAKGQPLALGNLAGPSRT